MDNSKIITAIRNKAKEIMPKGASVTLFGSRARGDARNDSDWDLLVLVQQDELSTEERSDYIYPLFSLGWELNIEINPIIYTTKSWKEQSITPFYKNVVNEGIIIWD